MKEVRYCEIEAANAYPQVFRESEEGKLFVKIIRVFRYEL